MKMTSKSRKSYTLKLLFKNLSIGCDNIVENDAFPEKENTQVLVDYLRQNSKSDQTDDITTHRDVSDDAFVKSSPLAPPISPILFEEEKAQRRRGSTLSCSSTSSLPYYSALEDGFTSEATIEYFSPLEDFSVFTDDFFSPTSDPAPPRNTPTLASCFQKPFNFEATIDDEDDLFVPRPSHLDSCSVIDNPSTRFQITSFDTITSISEHESHSSCGSGCVTPAADAYDDINKQMHSEKLHGDLLNVLPNFSTDKNTHNGSNQKRPSPCYPFSTSLSALTQKLMTENLDTVNDDVDECVMSSFNQIDNVPAVTTNITRPSFEEIFEDIAAKSCDSVTFTAVVQGGPKLSTTWFKNDRPIQDNQATSGGQYPRYYLTIPCVTSENVGVYACRVSNAAGDATCKAELSLCDPTELALQSPSRYRELYNVIKPLGEGSRGSVKLIQSRLTKETLSAKYVKRQEEEHVKVEMSILGKLRHQNIVKFYEGFSTANYVIMVAEACQQELFDYFLTISNFSEERVARFIESLCRALEYLHHQGIIHLSIRPESLLVSTDQQLKLINFDDAVQIEPHDLAYCDWGSPEFVAPEIVTLKPVTSLTDMWSVGVVTYIACTGVSPFAGVTDQSTLLNVKNHNWKLIRDESLSNSFYDFIDQLICSDSEERMTSLAASDHIWLKKSRHVNRPMVLRKLEMFQNRRSKQRSLISTKSAYSRCPISSLLCGEFDSASLGVPRNAESSWALKKRVSSISEDPIVISSFDNDLSSPSKETAPEASKRREKFGHSRSQSGSMDRPLTVIGSSQNLKDSIPNRSDEEPLLKRDAGSLRTKMWKKKLSSDGKKVSFDDELVKPPAAKTCCNAPPSDASLQHEKQPTHRPRRVKQGGTKKRRKGTLCWMRHHGDTSTSSEEDEGNPSGPTFRTSENEKRRVWSRSESDELDGEIISNSTTKPHKGILKKGSSFPDENPTHFGDSKMFKDLELDSNSTAARRRRSWRRGTSEDSTLSFKIRSSGLRGPLFERQRNEPPHQFGDISRQFPLALNRDVAQHQDASDKASFLPEGSTVSD